MQFSAAQIAQIIGGQIEGDGNVSVGSFGKIEEAKTGQLAFLANPNMRNTCIQQVPRSSSLISLNS